MTSTSNIKFGINIQGQNVGDGEGEIFAGKDANTLLFKTLKEGGDIKIIENGDEIIISGETGGDVNSVSTGVGLSGDTTTGDITIRLDNTTVTPDQYGSATQVPQFTVDQQGRITNVTNVEITGGDVNSVSTGVGLSGDTTTGDITIRLDNTTVTPDQYGSATEVPQFMVDQQGRITNVSNVAIDLNDGTVTQIDTNNGITGGPITDSGTIGLTGQALALHNLSTNGLITRTGASTVTSREITAGTGIDITNGDGIGGNPIITLNDTTVTPDIYGDSTNVPQFTVDQQGRITSVSNVSIDISGGDVNSVTTGVGLSGDTTTGDVTIRLDNTGVTPAQYGSATEVAQFTVDQQGRITSASNVEITGGGGGGVSTFTELTDTPINYTDANNHFVKVNASGDGLEFVSGASAGDNDIQLSDGSGGFIKVDEVGVCAKYEGNGSWTLGSRLDWELTPGPWYPSEVLGFHGIGQCSFVFSEYNIASQGDTIAMGNSNIAYEYGGVAIGNANIAGVISVAMGSDNWAVCGESVALGLGNRVYGNASVGIGSFNCLNCHADYKSCDYTNSFGHDICICGSRNIGVGNRITSVGNDIMTLGFGSSTTNLINNDANTLLIGSTVTTNQTRIHLKADCIETNKPLQIVDGTQGAGKVLTSDANGLGSWQTASGGGSTTFSGLTDTPATYVGNAGCYLRVNTGENALEYASSLAIGAGEPDGSIQYNNNGSLGGTKLLWDNSINTFAWCTMSANPNSLITLHENDAYFDYCNYIDFRVDDFNLGLNCISILRFRGVNSDQYGGYVDFNWYPQNVDFSKAQTVNGFTEQPLNGSFGCVQINKGVLQIGGCYSNIRINTNDFSGDNELKCIDVRTNYYTLYSPNVCYCITNHGGGSGADSYDGTLGHISTNGNISISGILNVGSVTTLGTGNEGDIKRLKNHTSLDDGLYIYTGSAWVPIVTW